VRWLDPEGRLAQLRPHADLVLRDVVVRVRSQLDVAGVVISVLADRRETIGGYGLGGRARSATDVRLYIDADFPNLAQVLTPRLAWLAAHELHHAARWRTAGYGSTLLEAMVSEGLADRFAEELLRAPQPPWIMAFPEESTAVFIARARPEFDSRSYNHAEWFFDASSLRPRWTAYTIGYRLVVAHQANNQGISAAALVSTSAAQFKP
jgi:uncharacterized protein YjaZ